MKPINKYLVNKHLTKNDVVGNAPLPANTIAGTFANAIKFYFLDNNPVKESDFVKNDKGMYRLKNSEDYMHNAKNVKEFWQYRGFYQQGTLKRATSETIGEITLDDSTVTLHFYYPDKFRPQRLVREQYENWIHGNLVSITVSEDVKNELLY